MTCPLRAFNSKHIHMPNFNMSLSANVLYNEAIHMLQINMNMNSTELIGVKFLMITAMDLAPMHHFQSAFVETTS